MLKKGSFINKKYHKLLICNLLSWGATGLNVMIDAIVGGYQLGETALSAVSIVSPIATVVLFTSLLFSSGYAIIVGKYIGEFNKDAAYKTAGEGIIVSIAKSIIMIILLLAFKNSYLAFFKCTGEMYNYASVYYNCMVVYMALAPLYMILYNYDLNVVST